MITAKLENKQQALKSLDAIAGVAKGRARIAVTRAAYYVQAQSQRIVPVETGDLKRSARVRVEGSGWNTVGHILYLQSYAIYVHENLAAKHAPGKTAKYLERIFIEHQAQIQKILEDTLKL